MTRFDLPPRVQSSRPAIETAKNTMEAQVTIQNKCDVLCSEDRPERWAGDSFPNLYPYYLELYRLQKWESPLDWIDLW